MLNTRLNASNRNLVDVVLRIAPLLMIFGGMFPFMGYTLCFASVGLYLDEFNSYFVAYYVVIIVQLILGTNPFFRTRLLGIVVGTLLTIEAVMLTLFAQYHPILTMLLVAGIGVLMFFMQKKVLAENGRTREMTQSVRKTCKNRARSVTAIILCVVLVAPAAMGIYEEYYSSSLSAEEWAVFLELFNEYSEQSESINKQVRPYADKLQGLAEWDSLSFAEKEHCLRMVAMIERENLGIPDEVDIAVNSEKMDGNTYGYYSHTNKKICLNYEHVNAESITELLDTILHEMHHAFMYYTIETLDFEDETVKTSYYYKQAREWKENSENYISASSYGFEMYSEQPIEADARAYAKARLEFYDGYLYPTADYEEVTAGE